MEALNLCSSNSILPTFTTNSNGNKHPYNFRANYLPPLTKKSMVLNCRSRTGDYNDADTPLSNSSDYRLLGVEPSCSAAELKAAFRAKVKQFHPDVNISGDSDLMIYRAIEAYQKLTDYSCECLDPFDKPECEAFDVFVNEVLCVGRGCSYSCVERAPHAFAFCSSTGTACAGSQVHGEDYQVQQTVGQCPRRCIHYVTPSQRVILEELLDSIMDIPV